MTRERYEFFATCLAGVEAALADELGGLGIRRVRPLKGGVAFFGEALDAERVCLWSRLASRVTLVLGRVDARAADALYASVYALPWESILAKGASIAVRARGTNQALRNSQFTALKAKDAICDRLRDETGERPFVEAGNPDASFELRVHDERATLSLDLSGESLHRRSYLADAEEDDSALSVAHAAALLALSGAGERLARGWALFDPACDDGFVVCEAAALAADLAPGLQRAKWGFASWREHDADAWASLLDQADERFEQGLARLLGKHPDELEPGAAPDLDRVRIVGVSTSSPAIARARKHLRAAGLRAAASVEAAAVSDADAVLARVARVAARTGQGSAVVVAHIAPLGRDEGDARAVAEVTAFLSAAKLAPEGSLFAATGTGGYAVRFGVEAQARLSVGAGRVETLLELFDRAPAALCQLSIPNPRGGSDLSVDVSDVGAAQFAARLRKVLKERRKWAAREGVSCYRVYDADLPEYNAAIDVYEGADEARGKTFVHVAEYKAPASVDEAVARRRFNDMLAIIPHVMEVRPDHVFSKVRERSKGGSQYGGGRQRSYVTHVEEAGCLFEVDLAGYLDTGLFLDHRETRLMLGRESRRMRFLNLFAYTGAATVHAAAGGAASTLTVDLSQTYLDWARRNMELNGFTGSAHAFERADVTSWLREARRRRAEFDLVFVDPPTFSNSKAMGKRTWDVQRDHVELLIGVSRILSSGGVAVFSCNLRSFKPDEEQLARYGVELEDVTARTIPHDFERTPKIHKCYLVRRR